MEDRSGISIKRPRLRVYERRPVGAGNSCGFVSVRHCATLAARGGERALPILPILPNRGKSY